MACAVQPQIHVSLTRAYDSLDELLSDSTAVVIAIPESASTDTVVGVPVTVTTARVAEVIGGELVESSIAIQQFGTSSVLSPDTSPLLVAGHQYLLFVDILQGADGNATARYVITGDQGAFELEGTEFIYAGTEYVSTMNLPRSIANSEAAAIIGGTK